MNMRVISADSHMMEPADLWETRLDSKFRDRAPKVIKSESEDGTRAELKANSLSPGC